MITSIAARTETESQQGTRSPTLLDPLSTGRPLGSAETLACLPTHLNRLQAIQSMCESSAALPEFRLTLAEISLSMHGLDRYFAPLASVRQVTLSEIRETLRWVREHFSGDHLLEDVIQSLCVSLLQAQYEAWRVAKKGGRHEH